MADSINERLFTLLGGLVGGRTYPTVAPDLVVKPYIVYTEVISPAQVALDGKETISNTRMQIDCWAESFSGAQALALQVKTALRGWSVQNVPLFKQNDFDKDAKLHRVILDYSIWHND